ncbi:MAG TPA: hypothetical protein VFJ16_21510 [Longimicrobium sp.]|nr:hypothetical protein [Longimicrobium sp.]
MGNARFSGPGERQVPNALHAGHIFRLPKGATWLNRDKPRPFVLSTDCTPSQLGTMVYGTTQETERLFAAGCIEVAPMRAGLNANGLSELTRFFPGILYPVERPQIKSILGYIGRRLPDLRAELRHSLGIGSGTCITSGVPAGSWRGRIVRLHDHVERDLRTPFAVLLTEHTYSREKRYQAIVPIYPGGTLRSNGSVLIVEHKPWMNLFSKPETTAAIPVQLIQSVWYPTDIAGETPHVIDDASLRVVEGELCARFSLPS